MKSIYFLALNALQFVPYAYGMLQNFARRDERIKQNYIWREPLTRIEAVNTTVAKIDAPDILCASCYVWNHNQQAAIAEQVKKRYPRCKVVFGGPHVPDASEAYFSKHPYVDALVHGEGEIPLYHLLLAFLDDRPELSHIPNISYNDDSKTVKTLSASGLPNDLPVPSPFLSGLFEKFLSDGGSKKIGLWETNRGCPHQCSFCDWGVRSTSKIRRHDMEKIKKEIDYIARHNIEDLYVTDCNFGILKRDLEITDELLKARKKYGYPKRVRNQFGIGGNPRLAIALFQEAIVAGADLSTLDRFQHLFVDTLHRKGGPPQHVIDMEQMADFKDRVVGILGELNPDPFGVPIFFSGLNQLIGNFKVTL